MKKMKPGNMEAFFYFSLASAAWMCTAFVFSMHSLSHQRTDVAAYLPPTALIFLSMMAGFRGIRNLIPQPAQEEEKKKEDGSVPDMVK